MSGELLWDLDQVDDWSDATCDAQGVNVETGNPDDHGNFEAGHLVIQLDNSLGKYSRYTTDGKSVHQPGDPISVWAHERDSGADHWLFNGTISRWDEFSSDGVVIIEAYDAFSGLAQTFGKYTPGVNGQTADVRLAAIMTAAGRGAVARRFAAGVAALTAQETEAAPLDEMQVVAASDGGVLFGDADGAVVYMGRNWRTVGRTDQPAIPAASDNVCSVGLIEVWACQLSNNDGGLADTVVFENVAGLRAISPAGSVPGHNIYSESDHQWTTQLEGDTLAAIVYTAHHDPRINVEEFDLYLYDDRQPELFTAVGWRLIDTLRFVHDYVAVGGIARLDVNTLIKTIVHDITPGQWIMTIQTTKGMSPNAVLVWNPAGDPYAWNSTDAVWGF